MTKQKPEPVNLSVTVASVTRHLLNNNPFISKTSETRVAHDKGLSCYYCVVQGKHHDNTSVILQIFVCFTYVKTNLLGAYSVIGVQFISPHKQYEVQVLLIILWFSMTAGYVTEQGQVY